MTTKPTGARLGAVIGSGTEFFHPYDDPRDQPVDTNVPMIVDALARRGVQVLDRGITRDETPLQVARIEAAVSIGANLVALNAGTGSQADDTFWRAVSQVTGRRLVADPELRRLVIRQQRRLGATKLRTASGRRLTSCPRSPRAPCGSRRPERRRRGFSSTKGSCSFPPLAHPWRPGPP